MIIQPCSRGITARPIHVLKPTVQIKFGKVVAWHVSFPMTSSSNRTRTRQIVKIWPRRQVTKMHVCLFSAVLKLRTSSSRGITRHIPRKGLHLRLHSPTVYWRPTVSRKTPRVAVVQKDEPIVATRASSNVPFALVVRRNTGASPSFKYGAIPVMD